MSPVPEIPRILVFGTGLTGAVLLALAVQILLAHLGLDLAAAWRGLIVGRAADLRAAFAWWVLAGISLVNGFVIAALARVIAESWWQLRLVRWLLGAGTVTGLALTGHHAGASSGLSVGENVGATLAAVLLSAVMAAFGAYFAARR